jgi:hypothetical protein
MSQWWENPGAFPGTNYDPSGLRHNPAGTIPFPYPQNAPSGLWDGGRGSLTWTNNADGLLTTKWSSPLFDLRPYLRAAQSGFTGGTPVWLPMGGGGKLWVQIDNIAKTLPAPATNDWTTNLQVIAREFGHINDPLEISQITADADITSEFTGAQDSAVLTFLPVGQGYPIRWYRVEVEFTYLIARAAPPPFAVCASYY